MTSRPSAPAKRVLVVEDSATIRRLLLRIIAEDPRLTLAAAVESAEEALERLPALRPDVVSMDIRLPGMDGLEATRRIMAEHPVPIVVVADAVEDASLRISLNALRCGALAVVQKPEGILSGGYAEAARVIATQLAIMSEVPVIRRRGMGSGGPYRPDPAAAPPARVRPGLVGIGASTGGPPALARLLGGLPADFPPPVLVVQHIGAPFVEGFASWLDGLVPIEVRVAVEGEMLRPGTARVAPGGTHLGVEAAGAGFRTRLIPGDPISGQCPSATVLFEQMAALGPAGLGVLLTGMGDDGATGLLAMRRAGAYTVTEHESSAVVYGMPAAAVRMGASCVQLPVETIAGHLLARLDCVVS